jgi:hypothetical protein
MTPSLSLSGLSNASKLLVFRSFADLAFGVSNFRLLFVLHGEKSGAVHKTMRVQLE